MEFNKPGQENTNPPPKGGGDVTHNMSKASDKTTLNVPRTFSRHDLGGEPEEIHSIPEAPSDLDRLVQGFFTSVEKHLDPNLAGNLRAQWEVERKRERDLEENLERNNDSNGIKIVIGACTHGYNKPNQDAYSFDEKGKFAVVCDGVGGCPHGDIASRMVSDFCRERLSDLSSQNLSVENAEEKMIDMLREGNEMIKRENLGMGTTALAIMMVKNEVDSGLDQKDGSDQNRSPGESKSSREIGYRVVIGDAGDCRAYRISKGSILLERSKRKGLSDLDEDEKRLLEAAQKKDHWRLIK